MSAQLSRCEAPGVGVVAALALSDGFGAGSTRGAAFGSGAGRGAAGATEVGAGAGFAGLGPAAAGAGVGTVLLADGAADAVAVAPPDFRGGCTRLPSPSGPVAAAAAVAVPGGRRAFDGTDFRSSSFSRCKVCANCASAVRRAASSRSRAWATAASSDSCCAAVKEQPALAEISMRAALACKASSNSASARTVPGQGSRKAPAAGPQPEACQIAAGPLAGSHISRHGSSKNSSGTENVRFLGLRMRESLDDARRWRTDHAGEGDDGRAASTLCFRTSAGQPPASRLCASSSASSQSAQSDGSAMRPETREVDGTAAAGLRGGSRRFIAKGGAQSRRTSNSTSPQPRPSSGSVRLCHSFGRRLQTSRVALPRLSSRMAFAFITSSSRLPGPSPTANKNSFLSYHTGLRLLFTVGVLCWVPPRRATAYGSDTSPKRPVSVFSSPRAAKTRSRSVRLLGAVAWPAGDASNAAAMSSSGSRGPRAATAAASRWPAAVAAPRPLKRPLKLKAEAGTLPCGATTCSASQGGERRG
mmetsp:Transcript_12957/g.40695  ORF Transcript_12957/g.40695 Transcript_12957/m.40695 type:complete len:529 (+) Transcript_12957:960-2546(+)